MKRYSVSALATLAIFAAFWAYTVADTLVGKFAKSVTYIDLSVLFILGFISGLSLGLIFTFRNGKGVEARQSRRGQND